MTSSHSRQTGRLGIIGTENSHAELIVRHLNVENRFGSWRVTALSGPDPDHDAQLASLGAVGDHVPDVYAGHEEMVGVVDAVIVTDRDGGLHREHAVPLLRRGLPVLVDKPLATSIEDAEAILDTAIAADALVTSYSALRWASEVAGLADSVGAGRLRPAAAFAVGPAEIESEHGGIFYYGVHPVEALCQILPGEIGPVAVSRTPETLVVHTSVGGVDVTIALLEPSDGDWAPFHVSIAGRNEVEGGDVVLGPDYLVAGLDRFFEMIESGSMPLPHAELMRPVTLLDAIRASMEA